MAGGVAHEFNNLLLVLMGHADRIVAALGPQHQAAGDVAGLKRASEAAARLTNELLAISERQVLLNRRVRINDWLVRQLPALARVAGSRVAVHLDLDDWVPDVDMDGDQILRAVSHLVANARDAMTGGGTITVSSTNVDARAVRVTVRDTGRGISDDVRARMFEPFFTTKGGGPSTGLGLATARGIVHQSGGTISVETDLDAGTAVTITLPAATVTQ